MSTNKIEEAFQLTEKAINLLKNALNVSYLDAYIENGENLLDNYQAENLTAELTEETRQSLNKIYQQFKALELTAEELRKLSQLILLRGMKSEPLQPNHQLTPDSIGILFVYLLEQLADKTKPLKILDITSGMGNLLLTVILNLLSVGYTVEGFGVDNDETLLEVSAVTNGITSAPIQLFHQDGLQELLIDPVDIAMSDLPIGYYPDDEKAKQFTTASKTEHSYAHHLLIEQAMHYVKPAGYGLFLVPANIFDTKQSHLLKNWLQENVYLQGMIQLPEELFHSKQSQKSILFLQKHGNSSQQAEEILLVRLSSLKEISNITEFFKQFEAWKTSNFK